VQSLTAAGLLQISFGATLSADADVSAGHGLHLFEATLNTGGKVSIVGDAQFYGATESSVGSFDISGSLSSNGASISGAGDVGVGGNLSVLGSTTFAAHSLTAGGATLDMGARLSVSVLNISGGLSLAPGAQLIADSGPLYVGTLQMAAAAQLTSTNASLTVTREVQLAPHFLLECPGDQAPIAAGTGTLNVPPTAAVNASATCKWPWHSSPYEHADRYGSHVPAPVCRIDTKVCGSDHAADYEASWLKGLLQSHTTSTCLVGTSGKSIFASDFDKTMPCA